MSSVWREPLKLPDDVEVCPVAELPAELRRQIGAGDRDFAISRPRARATTQLVDAQGAALLRLFRTPLTMVKAVALFSRERKLDPERTLEEALPLLEQLISARLLVPADAPAAEAIGARLAAGERCGGYTVARCLQVLEDSEIHQARAADGDWVALKVARPGHEQAVVPRLAREAEALERLAGAAAPRLIEARLGDDPPCLVLSWCAGSEITRAAADARADPARLLPLLVATAEAYAGLHARGVVHGDVHPGNLLVDRDGAVSLLDFGLSVVSGTELPAAERGGVSFFYEPEWAQAILAGRSPPPTGTHAEQYGVAALLYLLATGHHRVEFRLDRETMLRQLADEPPRAFAEAGAAPWPKLEAVLGRALAHRPDRRFADMQAFATALAEVRPPEARRARRDAGAGSRLVGSLLEHLEPAGALFRDGLPAGPVCSLNLGAAGIAYALYRLACVRDDAALIGRAEVWLQKALRDGHRDDAFTNPELELTTELAGAVSPYHSAAGVHWVRALIARAAGDPDELNAAVDAFVEHSRKPCPAWDLVLGRLGTVLACALLLEADPEAAGIAIDPLRRLAAARLSEVWREVDAAGPADASPELPNLGIAHGWAGLLFATLRWHQASGDPLPAAFDERLSQLGAATFPSGRGLSIPWRERLAGDERTMPGWCNGSAGLTHLGCLAYRLRGDEGALALAEGAAWNAWEGGDGLIDLCCGLAGRGYALLAMHETTGQLAWLERARDLARRAAHLAPEQRTPEHPRHSLFKGELGLALLLAELERPEVATMPVFGRER